jgi:outer membrane protein, multidrug efflux system
VRCLLAACLIAGCATQPRRPDVTLPKHWSLAAVSGQHSAPNLWDRFQCAELSELLRSAHQNLDYASAQASLAEQHALARLARAPLYPSFSVEASLSAQSANSRSLGSVSGGFLDAGLLGAFELDVWGKNSQRALAAAHTREAGRYARDETALRVAAGIADAYFALLSLRERIARGRGNLELTERILAVVESLARAGTALAREVAQQQALLATEQVRVEQLSAAESQARIELAIVAGHEPVVAAHSFEHVQQPVIDATDLQDPLQLPRRRPDVARAEAALAATHADVTAARRALLPQLRVLGQVAFQHAFLTRFRDFGSDAAYAADGSQLVYSGSIVATQPIFDGGALFAQRDAAAGRKLQAEIAYRRVLRDAVAEVERALRAVNSLQTQDARQREVVSEARHAVELLEHEYEGGAQDIVAVLDAQRTLFKAQDELSQLSAAKLRAAVALIKALGAGWSDHNT